MPPFGADWRNWPLEKKVQFLSTIQTELSKKPLNQEEQLEKMRCTRSVSYFVSNYAYIYNATVREWLRFDLWPAQADTLLAFTSERLILVLKARQLGLSWLAICYALWEMLFHPAAAILIFSQRDEEAIELLARLRGIYDRLPAFLQDNAITADNKHEFGLLNGSKALSFPTTGGRSYTGTLVLVDEADYIPDLQALINAVKPTIDAGGKMMMISTADKGQPESTFKRIYRAARHNLNEWSAVFLPWTARPDRTFAWYEAQKADILARTDATDDLFQEYPATDTEALAPRSLDKRISSLWIEGCFDEQPPLPLAASAPAIVGLELYKLPQRGRTYVVGGDPAEGNPNSDDSAATILDLETGEECAVLAGKYEPAIFGSHIVLLGLYYNDAPVMVERNNHGHAVIQWFADNAPRLRVLRGHDDKPGWLSSKLGKALLYTECADHFRQNYNAKRKILHSYATYHQLASIDGATLRAPDGMMDDRADSFALAQVGRVMAFAGVTVMRQAPIRGRGGASIIRKGYASKLSTIKQRRSAAPAEIEVEE